MSQFMKPVSACLGIFFFLIGVCLSRRLLKAIRSALLSLTNSRKEADLFLIDLMLRRQPLRDLVAGPGLRLISPERVH